MYPFYVAVQDGDDYRHLVEHITCDEDLMNFQEHVAELILGATEYFDEFRGIIERFHTPVYDEFHVTKESYVGASNYLGNLSDEDFLKLYDQSLRYELQDSQKEQYESSARIVKQYYENHRYNIYKK